MKDPTNGSRGTVLGYVTGRNVHVERRGPKDPNRVVALKVYETGTEGNISRWEYKVET